MAIIHSVDVIPKAVQHHFEEKHASDKVEFIPAIDPLGLISSGFNFDPPSFPNILGGIQNYLEFPYIQNDETDPYSIQTEFLNRIGTVVANISFFDQGALTGFIVGELQLTVEQMRQKVIEVNQLTAKEVEERIVRTSEKEVDVYNDYSDDPENLEIITVHEYHLQLSPSVDLSYALPIERQTDEVFSEKDKFLILDELGVLEFLTREWTWMDDTNEDDGLSTNDTKFAKVLSAVFGFENPGTVRTYIRDLRNRREKFYSPTKAEEIKAILSRHGIKRSKKG